MGTPNSQSNPYFMIYTLRPSAVSELAALVNTNLRH
jgi:hypothetical protein